MWEKVYNFEYLQAGWIVLYELEIAKFVSVH